jgi:hypothetical protein
LRRGFLPFAKPKSHIASFSAVLSAATKWMVIKNSGEYILTLQLASVKIRIFHWQAIFYILLLGIKKTRVTFPLLLTKASPFILLYELPCFLICQLLFLICPSKSSLPCT